MLWFLLGFFAGALFGVVIMCIFNVSSQASRAEERRERLTRGHK